MKVDDILDAKVGSSQVTAIYLGNTLVWPTAVYTYEITSALLHFSRGYRIDAGELNSNYSGNYAWITGTVIPYRDGVAQTPLTDVMLDPVLTNTTDFVVLRDYYIYGHNLGTSVTTQMKSTYVDVTYKGSPSFRVGSAVEQILNTETITAGTPYTVDTSTETYTDVIAGSYDLVLQLSRYNSRLSPCPAYGDTAGLTCYGWHREAQFSRTWWVEWTPYTHSFTSGSSYVIEEETNSGHTTPVQIGDAYDVNDVLEDNITFSFSDGGDWASYDYATDTLTIDNAGKTTYAFPRFVTITATNETASATVTAYQQANQLESSSYTYDIYLRISRTTDFPAAGGTFPVIYRSQRVLTEVYTSGTYTGDATPCYSSVSTTQGTLSVSRVSGSGLVQLSLSSNMGGTKYVAVTIQSEDDISQSDYDWRYQQGDTMPYGLLYPVVNAATGVVSMKWEWNSESTAPTYPLQIVFTGLVYHYVLDGSSTEYTTGITGEVTATFSANETAYSLSNKVPAHLGGTSGRNWFTASSVTGVGYDVNNPTETFPTDKTFSVREIGPITPIEE